MQPRVLERHFLDLRKKYGAVLAVDLVNKVSILSFHNELRVPILTILPDGVCNCVINFLAVKNVCDLFAPTKIL